MCFFTALRDCEEQLKGVKDATRRDHERRGRDHERQGRDQEREGRDYVRHRCDKGATLSATKRNHEREGSYRAR